MNIMLPVFILWIAVLMLKLKDFIKKPIIEEEVDEEDYVYKFTKEQLAMIDRHNSILFRLKMAKGFKCKCCDKDLNIEDMNQVEITKEELAEILALYDKPMQLELVRVSKEDN